MQVYMIDSYKWNSKYMYVIVSLCIISVCYTYIVHVI